ncbi:MAG: ATP-binding protein, partial [Dehalococcoidia bacterium]
SPNRRTISIVPVVEAVITIARETMDRRIWFSTDIADDLPDVLADSGQIEQVLLNLLVNARDAVVDRADVSDYHYRPSIRVSVTAETRERAAGVAVRVADNGPGMTEAVRRRAFDPFFTTKSVDRGTGLGLSIASGILASHQGFLDLETREGTGTTMTVWLPTPTDGAATPARPALATPRPTPARGRVLLVDDERMIGEVAEAYLAGAGFEVTLATSGAEAIRLARDAAFDIAVIDLNMPPPDGWAVLSVLRVMQPDVPVVIASGFAAAADVAERGGAALLPKPYNRDQLVAVVTGLLG